MKKILIMGLPGNGKTTLSKLLAAKLKAVHFNADEIRAEVNKDLGFSIEHRIEHARRMGILCDIVVRAGHYAIGDFVCPTQDTRRVFGADYVVWIQRLAHTRYADTEALFQPPEDYDLVITEGEMEFWANYIAAELKSLDKDATPPTMEE